MFIPSLDVIKRDVSTQPMAIVGPNDGDSSTTDGTLDDYISDHSFAHRFIGVWIVVGLVVVGLGLWVYFAKWPRRMLRRVGLTCIPEPSSKKGNMVEVGDIIKEGERRETRVSFQPSPQPHPHDHATENRKTELTPSCSRSTDASVDPRNPAVK